MESEYRIPGHPFCANQYIQTPDNGLVYLGNCTLIYLRPQTDKNHMPQCQHLPFKAGIKSVDCPTEWDESNKHIAVLDKFNSVGIWNVESGVRVAGHKGHIKKGFTDDNTIDDNLPGALCYITNGTGVLSIADSLLIKYCSISNTYFTVNDISKHLKNTTSVLRSCPFDENIFVAGTTKGLIVICSLTDFNVLYTLRGHDTEINSIEWLRLDCTSKSVQKAKTKKSPSGRVLKQIIDTNDMFDVYSFDHLENEFGALVENKTSTLTANQVGADGNADKSSSDRFEEMKDNSNFDFVEACANLREDILRSTSPDENEKPEILDEKQASADDFQIDHDFERIDDTTLETFDASDANEISKFDDDEITLEDLNSTMETTLEVSIEKRTFLVSSSRENFLWIWDPKSGTSVHKIEMKGRPVPDFKANCCALNDTTLISNSPQGDLISWTISMKNDKINCFKKQLNFLENEKCLSIMTKRSSIKSQLNQIWIFTKNRKILYLNIGNDQPEILLNYSTVPMSLYEIRECPHDRNKIAVAGYAKRISIFNITNIHSIKAFCNRIQARILSLAWHPKNENILAFGTNEGTVALLDTSKFTNAPNNFHSYSGKGVYQLSWGYISKENSDEQQLVLWSCSGGKLVYFMENVKKSIFVPVDDKKICAVSAGTKYVALGSDDGYLIILSAKLKKLWSTKISNKYISECAWNPINPNKLAASSTESDIHLFDVTNIESNQVDVLGQLKGTQNYVTAIRWNYENENRLISNGLDGLVCIWNTETLKCIAQYKYPNKIFAACFSPINEHMIICSGDRESFHMFDMRNHLIGDDEEPKKIKSEYLKIEWATEIDRNVKKLKEKETKKQKKELLKKELKTDEQQPLANEDNELIDAIQAISLSTEQTVSKSIHAYTTVMYLSNRELNKFPMKCFRSILKKENETTAENDDAEENVLLQPLLFSTRDDVKKLLNKELENHQTSNTESIGRLLIPIATADIQNEIVKRITMKCLTQQDISVAPMISYDFWKKCCKAFAFQCIEKNCTLMAIPYLLCCHEIDEAIECLCESKFYREAWSIAKLHKLEDDVIFETISKKWIQSLRDRGDLEGAAFIAVGIKDYEQSVDILSSRRNLCDESMQIIELMMEKISK